MAVLWRSMRQVSVFQLLLCSNMLHISACKHASMLLQVISLQGTCEHVMLCANSRRHLDMTAAHWMQHERLQCAKAIPKQLPRSSVTIWQVSQRASSFKCDHLADPPLVTLIGSYAPCYCRDIHAVSARRHHLRSRANA